MPEGYRRAGLGDIVAFLTTVAGIKHLVKWLYPDCGCTTRQAWLNRHFPLPFRVRKTGDPVLDGE